MAWRCDWCRCLERDSKGKDRGPRGSSTLCARCSQRFRRGHSAPPTTDMNGCYVCEKPDGCGRTFTSLVGLSSHRRSCSGGRWRCEWCHCTEDECMKKNGKDKGPSGSATLCARCSQRYRRGQSPPQQQSQASASKRQRTEGKPRSAARETTARKNGRASQQTPPHPHQHHLLLRQAGLAGGTSGQVVATSSTTVGEEIADV